MIKKYKNKSEYKVEDFSYEAGNMDPLFASKLEEKFVNNALNRGFNISMIFNMRQRRKFIFSTVSIFVLVTIMSGVAFPSLYSIYLVKSSDAEAIYNSRKVSNSIGFLSASSAFAGSSPSYSEGTYTGPTILRQFEKEDSIYTSETSIEFGPKATECSAYSDYALAGVAGINNYFAYNKNSTSHLKAVMKDFDGHIIDYGIAINGVNRSTHTVFMGGKFAARRTMTDLGLSEELPLYDTQSPEVESYIEPVYVTQSPEVESYIEPGSEGNVSGNSKVKVESYYHPKVAGTEVIHGIRYMIIEVSEDRGCTFVHEYGPEPTNAPNSVKKIINQEWIADDGTILKSHRYLGEVSDQNLIEREWSIDDEIVGQSRQAIDSFFQFDLQGVEIIDITDLIGDDLTNKINKNIDESELNFLLPVDGSQWSISDVELADMSSFTYRDFYPTPRYTTRLNQVESIDISILDSNLNFGIIRVYDKSKFTLEDIYSLRDKVATEGAIRVDGKQLSVKVYRSDRAGEETLYLFESDNAYTIIYFNGVEYSYNDFDFRSVSLKNKKIKDELRNQRVSIANPFGL